MPGEIFTENKCMNNYLSIHLTVTGCDKLTQFHEQLQLCPCGRRMMLVCEVGPTHSIQWHNIGVSHQNMVGRLPISEIDPCTLPDNPYPYCGLH